MDGHGRPFGSGNRRLGDAGYEYTLGDPFDNPAGLRFGDPGD